MTMSGAIRNGFAGQRINRFDFVPRSLFLRFWKPAEFIDVFSFARGVFGELRAVAGSQMTRAASKNSEGVRVRVRVRDIGMLHWA